MNHFQLLSSAILARYFKHFYCVFLITDGGNLDAINLHLAGDVKLVTYETTKLSEIDLELACQGFIVYSTEILKTLVHLEAHILKDEAGSFHDRRYLLLSPDGYGQELFGDPILEHVKDLLLVMAPANKRGTFKLSTHRFVGQDFADPVFLDAWSSGSFLKHADLYPDKTSDFKGKTVRLSSFSYIPYDFLGESFEESSGIEISLLAEFGKRKNLRVVLIDAGDGKWGKVYENGTGVGIIGDVKTFQSELALGSLLIHQAITPRADFTFPTMKIRIKCLVPKPRIIINWLIPFTQFSPELWCLLIFLLVFSSLALVLMVQLEGKTCVFERASNRKTTFLEALFSIARAVLSQGSVAEDYFRRFKGMFVFIFLLTLIITTCYNSTLASRMVIPRYENLIDTVEDLARSGLQWGGRNKNEWTESFATDKREKYKKIRNNFIEISEEEILELGHAGVFGFPIDQLPSGNFAIQSDMDEATLKKLRPMKHELFSGLSVIFIRKNYVLLSSLNEYLLRVTQSGLLDIWELEGVIHLRFRLQNLLKYSDENREKIPLSLSHIKGVFGLWLVGVVAAILTFFYEVFHAKKILFSSYKIAPRH